MTDDLAKKLDPRYFMPKVPPPAFSMEQHKDDFETWKRKWQMFLAYTGISRLIVHADGDSAAIQRDKEKALKDIKAGALYAALDKETARMVSAMVIADPDDADQIITALEKRLVESTNIRVHRKLLSERVRRHDETEEEFFEDINRLYSRCKFTLPASAEELHSMMVTETLIRNINDKETQEHLLRLPVTSTLDEVRKTISSVLGARKGARQMTGDEPALTARMDVPARSTDGGRGMAQRQGNEGPTGAKCKSCGTNSHPGKSCWAKDKECFRCRKKGHLSRCCPNPLTPKAANVESGDTAQGEGGMASIATWPAMHNMQVLSVPKGWRQPDPLKRLASTTVEVTPYN